MTGEASEVSKNEEAPFIRSHPYTCVSECVCVCVCV
jgi:hypothetical protein